MRKIFKQAGNDTQKELGEGTFGATSRDTRADQLSKLISNADRQQLENMSKLNLRFAASKKVLDLNFKTLKSLKEQSLVEKIQISAEPCGNINYVIRFVGVPQLEEYYDAVNKNFTAVLTIGAEIEKYFNDNRDEIQKLTAQNVNVLNLKLKPTKPATTTQQQNSAPTIQANTHNKIFKIAQAAETSTTTSPDQVEKDKAAQEQAAVISSLQKATHDFLNVREAVNELQREYQFFYADYTIFSQTKEIAIEFQNIMMIICSAKTQFDSDKAQYGTGTREDRSTILSLYPQAISLAETFNKVVIQNLPRTTVAPVTETGEGSGAQSQQKGLDKRQIILTNQMNFIVKQMKLDRRKYVFSPFESLFRPTK